MRFVYGFAGGFPHANAGGVVAVASRRADLKQVVVTACQPETLNRADDLVYDLLRDDLPSDGFTRQYFLISEDDKKPKLLKNRLVF